MAVDAARAAELDNLVMAMARWLDAAQTMADDAEERISALEEARRRLSTCVDGLPLGMRPVARRAWARTWTLSETAAPAA